jgi:malate dehydrogenase (oxaloacetate-decarboxylating)
MLLQQCALELHRQLRGKIHIAGKLPLRSREDLALAYTPGVAAACEEITRNPEAVWEVTGRWNSIAIVTDGSAVLGLGDRGPEAALPVMEGKALLFKELADIDAVPLCLHTRDPREIIRTIQLLEPTFGGVNLEDISAPRCFEVEETLKNTLAIPIFHDDQHGTAVVVLAALMNAMRVRYQAGVRRQDHENVIVISGAGAAGTAIARMLLAQGMTNLLVVDRRGIITRTRSDLSAHKTFLAATTNPQGIEGTLTDALRGADVFIGVSVPKLVTEDMLRSMNAHPIVFALANPEPEISREQALAAGAAVVATGRSDDPNQVNNLLAFPGIFRGALDMRAKAITEEMNLAAAKALAASVSDVQPDRILPDPLDRSTVQAIAQAVKNTATQFQA